jgi:HlyD family secretion protein
MKLPTFVLMVAVLAISGCSPAEKEKEPIVTVQTAPAQKQKVSQLVKTEAVVFPLKQATVAPKITSTIAEFMVQRGSHVRKGQLLAILENKDLAAQAEASKGDFEQADANYAITVDAGLPQQVQKAEFDAAVARSAFEATQKVYDSRKDLFQQGAIPRRDLDSAEVALAQARSQHEQAQKQLADLQRMGKEQLLKAAKGTKESAEGHYRAASAQLSYSEIRSPIDGVVTDRPLYVGDLAAANQAILTVMDVSSLVAKAHIPQSDTAQLKIGDAARIILTDGQESAGGRVTLISPALDPGSTTTEVWVETKKTRSFLKPGMTVDLEITAKTVNDAIAVPSSALFKNADGTSYLLVAGSDKKAHQKVVRLGVRNADLTQITSGINAGELVIVSGGYALPDGTAIEIEKPASSEKDGKAEPDGQPEKDKE